MISYEKKIDLLKDLKFRFVSLEFDDSRELTVLQHRISMILKKILDENEVDYYLKEIKGTNFYPMVYGDLDISYEKECWEFGRSGYLAVIDSILEKLEFDKLFDSSSDEPTNLSNPIKDKIKSNKVFIVHGRDESMKFQVKDFIKNIGLEPVILHEQLDNGQTVIEKFLNEAKEVDYAIVLFSPDDEGKLKNSDEDLKSRARQNVILEYGFFVGVLGRENTFALVKNDIELPNDMSGLIYCEYRDEWKIKISKSLTSRGYEVDSKGLLR